MVDRSKGSLGVGFWADDSAQEASVEAVNPIRNAVADAKSLKITSVESFGLVAQRW
jgi:hypothetical protein